MIDKIKNRYSSLNDKSLRKLVTISDTSSKLTEDMSDDMVMMAKREKLDFVKSENPIKILSYENLQKLKQADVYAVAGFDENRYVAELPTHSEGFEESLSNGINVDENKIQLVMYVINGEIVYITKEKTSQVAGNSFVVKTFSSDGHHVNGKEHALIANGISTEDLDLYHVALLSSPITYFKFGSPSTITGIEIIDSNGFNVTHEETVMGILTSISPKFKKLKYTNDTEVGIFKESKFRGFGRWFENGDSLVYFSNSPNSINMTITKEKNWGLCYGYENGLFMKVGRKKYSIKIVTKQQAIDFIKTKNAS